MGNERNEGKGTGNPEVRVWVKDIAGGKLFEGQLVVRRFAQVPYRDTSKGHYLSMLLEDRTGKIEGRVWEKGDLVPRIAQVLQENRVYRVRGLASEYQGSTQLHLQMVEPVDPLTIDWEVFLPVTPCNRQELWRRCTEAMGAVEQPHLRALLQGLLDDPAVRRAYTTAPAAMTHHQAYIGGLLEHSLGVVDVALRLAETAPMADRDLLIAGALLHDIGKIDELQYDTLIGYTDEGNLLGHIVIGIMRVERAIERVAGFPAELRLQLLHIIASHHGEYEYQSPKRPKTMESLILHMADRFDAEKDKVLRGIDEARDNWTPWLKGMDRKFYVGTGKER
ncbi:3'-5' exoribonuclease YhaM family protein [Heliophilum fasciatum]|uniref:3'-5' exoribonuclease n=1 Tax=Heliophilum fasciatum TaxID=35700 RepID=A0A4R2RX81_9FIRM|nr:HD domain-containing protein [Heliophilum fasciatum]MCW2277262.1 3'-5' exoribonuclease [Heliophilum fasciatum]TCP68104.1 3'-5' exoribonuclease [Heliophilum fasciatum]